MENAGPPPQIDAHEVTNISALGSMRPIAHELKPHLKYVIANQIICILVLALGATVPFGLKYLTEEIMAGNWDALIWLPPLVFVLMVLLAVGNMARELLSQYISIKISQSLQQKIFSHFLREDIVQHGNRPVGEKMSRMTYDIQWFVQGTAIFLSETLFLPLVIIGCLGIMFYLDWRLACIAVVISPIGLVAGKPFSRKLRESSMDLQGHYANLSRHILDSLKGLLLIKVFAREPQEQDQLRNMLDEFLHLNVRNNLWSGFFHLAIEIGNALVICLVSWATFYFLVKQESLEVPTLVAFAAIMMFFFSEVSKLGGVMNMLTRASVSVERIFRLLSEPIDEQVESDNRAKFTDSLRFDKVSFDYGDKRVFSDVNLTIKSGEKIALMGMSGAGKTTLINLMLKLLDPLEGTVYMDGQDIRECNTTSLRDQFGYSPQLSVLFFMTVAENIGYSRPGATLDEIKEAAKIACAHDFIMALPNGYDTMLGDDGANLSEGQRQRLALARGVLREAPILVLDESSAHVDLKTEQEIYKNIKSIPGRTVILVSHRPTVLREADRIFSIADGKVDDVGSFEEYKDNLTDQELLGSMEFVH